MEIPSDVQILGSIVQGAVYYFVEDSYSSDDPHYHVVLNGNPRERHMAVLVAAQSNVKKRMKARSVQGIPTTTLVHVQPSEYSQFTVPSIFDCNSILERSIEELAEKIESGDLRICSDTMPDHIVQNLITAVLSSPLVERSVKEILRNG